MAWCVGNAKVEPRANGILITKQASWELAPLKPPALTQTLPLAGDVGDSENNLEPNI